MAERVRSLVEVDIPIMGHIGLMPQRASISGYSRLRDATPTPIGIIRDAEALEEAEAFALVLEFIAAEAAEAITERLSIPTIGVGSGLHCDGQALVLHDT